MKIFQRNIYKKNYCVVLTVLKTPNTSFAVQTTKKGKIQETLRYSQNFCGPAPPRTM